MEAGRETTDARMRAGAGETDASPAMVRLGQAGPCAERASVCGGEHGRSGLGERQGDGRALSPQLIAVGVKRGQAPWRVRVRLGRWLAEALA